MKKIDAVIHMHRSGDHVGAISGYRRLLKQDPANARLHGLLGLAMIDSGQLDPAEAEFRRALLLDSGQVDAL
jgi:Flp pilus assembly protein TadD